MTVEMYYKFVDFEQSGNRGAHVNSSFLIIWDLL